MRPANLAGRAQCTGFGRRRHGQPIALLPVERPAPCNYALSVMLRSLPDA
jgi:hypothetical protein